MRKWLKRIHGAISLTCAKPTGLERDSCVYCGSKNIRTVRRKWLELPYQLPETVLDISDQMHRRDNGKCMDCDLEQSFFVFSDPGRRKLYSLGLEELSSEPTFGEYPPPLEFRERIFEQHYKNRLPKWQRFFEEKNLLGKRALVLRCYYGQVLKALFEWWGGEIWAKDMTLNCERWINDEMPFVRIPEGGLSGRIELEFCGAIPKFDLIVCFHTLTNSVDFPADLEYLKKMLSPRGAIIFCDEITKKPLNPFHMVHFDEQKLVEILEDNFYRVNRIDDSGIRSRHVTPYTLKGDNPDIVAFSGGA